ncbi:hypothetical protein DL766_005474 [Monosporascus sp. MC13-8B]|uniref:Uncharacterized protein n=1 Tax=Monosporascus cannonballus TaxID=155416 RepID=A0ABY0HBK6_9PEZI|nr:hypothetical protein DL763_010391 [Monosporascus cannonballus]RYO87617.1 hypothetical protein DL762_004161 [Monosporascus cannonballus]RYP29187.1 hypothetical protein DL766_005474 [Monosporascus sp. MC13-8B]
MSLKFALDYGLGADQILEAGVLLADGKVVTASACENADLYRALRGGRPGYGITLSSTVKACPSVDVVAVQRLLLSLQLRAPSSSGANTSSSSMLLNAWATIHQALPDLNGARFCRRGLLCGRGRGTAILHAQDLDDREVHRGGAGGLRSTRGALLARLGDTVLVSKSYASFPDYWAFYDAGSAVGDPMGSTLALTSRRMDCAAVPATLEAVTGGGGGQEKQEQAAVVVALPSPCGGRVCEDRRDPNAGLHPAWRTSDFLTLVGKGVPPANATSSSSRREVMDDLTYRVGGAAEDADARDRGVHERGRPERSGLRRDLSTVVLITSAIWRLSGSTTLVMFSTISRASGRGMGGEA